MELHRKAMGCQAPNLCFVRPQRAGKLLTAGNQSTLMLGDDDKVLCILQAPGTALDDVELTKEYEIRRIGLGKVRISVLAALS